jgi:hypothetical protein
MHSLRGANTVLTPSKAPAALRRLSPNSVRHEVHAADSVREAEQARTMPAGKKADISV